MNNDFTGAPLNGTYYFFQYYDPSMTHAYTILNQYGPAVGSSHTYLTLLDETNTYYGTVDNATVASYPSGFTGIFTEYSGEIDNNNSAYFAGSSNNGLYMWNIYNAYMSGGTKVWVLSPQLDFNTINQNPYGVLYQGSWVVGNPNASFNYWDTRN